MNMIGLDHARILVVDDQDDNVHLLERILGPTYVNIKGITAPGLALAAVAEFEPDLVLLDLHMPGTSGFAILEQLRQPGTGHDLLPVVVLTADSTPEARNRALELGATDYLTKPLDRREVLLRVRNTLQVSRVGELAAGIAESLGWEHGRVDMLRRAAPLHDVGKIAVPDAVLLKPARLNEAEFEVIKTHCVTGGRLLHGSNSRLLQQAESIAVSHHERWDGTGYPHQLAGEQIPIVGRVVAVADVFDSLTHERVYKQAWSREDAGKEIQSQAGRQFDPVIVSAFLNSPVIGRVA